MRRHKSGSDSERFNLNSRASASSEAFALNDEVFLQPWFVPKDVYLEIRRLLPNIHLTKMRYYFEDYGCLKCGDRKHLYGSNGLCERCSVLIRGRVARLLKRRLKAVGIGDPPPEIAMTLGSGIDAARSLLHGLRKQITNPRNQKTI